MTDSVLAIEQQKLLDELSKAYKTEMKEEDIQQIISQIKVLENFSSNKNRFFVLFSHQAFLPLYISANVIQHGYTPEGIANLSIYDGFKAIHWKQITMGIKLIGWTGKFTKLAINYPLEGDEIIFCGIKFKNRFGDYRSFMFKLKFLSVDKLKQPIYSFIEAEDITDLYKVHTYWGLFTSKSEHSRARRVYFSSGSKKESRTLLSPRELEVLQLILAEKQSQEISELLNISIETVRKHRKNMIARIGAKDMTALIQILKLSNIL